MSGLPVAAGYWLVALAILFGLGQARWRLTAGTVSDAAGQLEGQPYVIAYLNSGPQLALMAALSAMHLAGTIAADGPEVRAEGCLDARAPALERAIHLAAVTPIRSDHLDAHPSVAATLEQMRRWLEQAGLLLSAPMQRRIKRAGLGMLAVVGFGLTLLAVLAEASDREAIIQLLVVQVVLVMPCIGLCAAGDLPHTPRLSRRAMTRLESLHTRYAALAPQMRPDWNAYGPGYAALAVGIFGPSALWQADPDFAADLALGLARTRYGGYG